MSDEVDLALVEETRTRTLAEADACAARAERDRAERDLFQWQAADLELDMREHQIRVDREDHKRAKELAADEHFMFYPFNGSVDSASVNKCIDALSTWDRTRPDEPIEIQFNSPGGSVIDGLALWDFLTRIKQNHELTTSAIGYAASMAGILLQAGHTRILGKESWLMIHEASFSVGGKTGEVEDRVEWIKMIQGRFLRIFAERSNLSVAQLKRNWSRKDWWLDSDAALKAGLVDEIR